MVRRRRGGLLRTVGLGHVLSGFNPRSLLPSFAPCQCSWTFDTFAKKTQAKETLLFATFKRSSNCWILQYCMNFNGCAQATISELMRWRTSLKSSRKQKGAEMC
ncbi:hypothetical protein RvY_15265 [Ramazzottius varieornatus]|uniref:Uncharacterized protein n=1 Tax=Ramazzottius varieornatus TaxID=947166 RepID=A0A1D1W172_RAMVA|nr:hypothetical protein RvY_15265 [Ramazzottius varieornatus]